jgi:tetratricopeptide (TPR) repeat protein
MTTKLSEKIKDIMTKELQSMGTSVLEKQCQDLEIDTNEIEPEDLPALAGRLSEIIKTCAGFEKARCVYREIRKLEDLDAVVAKGESIESQITMIESLAKASLFAGEWDKATKYIDQLLSSASVVENKTAKSRYLMWMGLVHMDKSEFEVAIALFERALTEAKAAGNPSQLSRCYYHIGDVQWYKSDFSKALESYEMAASAATDNSDIGAAHIGIANVYQSKEDLAKAITHYIEALAKLRKTDNYRDTARAHNNLGDMYMQMGDWDNALANFEKGAELGGLSGWLYIKAFAQFNSAEALINKGEMGKAWEFLERSRSLLEQMGSKAALAGMHHVYGLYHMQTKDWKRMSESYEKSIDLYKDIMMMHYVAKYSYEYGLGLLKMGKREKAKEAFIKALALSENLRLGKMIDKVNRELRKM